MCLDITRHKMLADGTIKYRTAQKDIVVYKVYISVPRARKYVIRSPYRERKYALGELKKVKLKKKSCISYCGTGKVEQGYHSFRYYKHALLEVEDWRSAKVYRCLIPKGSKYIVGMFIGEFPNYVSDQLIVTEEQIK